MYANGAEVQSGGLEQHAGAGRREGIQSLRPSSRERFAAAETASSTAERKPCASRTRRAAAVVPPGEVTPALSTSGESPVSVRSRAEPSRVWTANIRLTSPFEALVDSGLDECLGQQEDIGRAGAGQPCYRVQLVLGKTSHDAEGGKNALCPGEVRLGD